MSTRRGMLALAAAGVAAAAVAVAMVARGGGTTTFQVETGGCGGKSALACCAGSEARLRRTLEGLDGVTEVVLDRSTRRATLKYRRGAMESEPARHAAANFGLRPDEHGHLDHGH